MKCYDMSSPEAKAAYKENPRLTTREELQQVLRDLGVFPGIRLVVHSSLGSLGTFEGGAENFCAAMQELVTEEGTLMFPALSKYPGDGEEYLYDPEKTPVRVGKAPEVFRSLPGVVRSWDPTHSFAVWGRDKEDFVRRHHLVSTMDEESPLGLLEKADGWCLMIGCHQSVTFMHVVETSTGSHCLGERTEEYPALLKGKLVKLRAWGWRNGECPALIHDRIYDFMRKEGSLKETMVGHSHLLLFKLAAYRRAYASLLTDPVVGCRNCPLAVRQVKQSVPSDWDPETRTLTGSDAFTGEWQP